MKRNGPAFLVAVFTQIYPSDDDNWKMKFPVEMVSSLGISDLT